MGLFTYFAKNFKLFMKKILSERNLVVVLFILVCITFVFAHEDSKKMEKAYEGVNAPVSAILGTLPIPPSPIAEKTAAPNSLK